MHWSSRRQRRQPVADRGQLAPTAVTRQRIDADVRLTGLTQPADFRRPGAMPLESLLGAGWRPVMVGQSNVGTWVKFALVSTGMALKLLAVAEQQHGLKVLA